MGGGRPCVAGEWWLVCSWTTLCWALGQAGRQDRSISVCGVWIILYQSSFSTRAPSCRRMSSKSKPVRPQQASPPSDQRTPATTTPLSTPAARRPPAKQHLLLSRLPCLPFRARPPQSRSPSPPHYRPGLHQGSQACPHPLQRRHSLLVPPHHVRPVGRCSGQKGGWRGCSGQHAMPRHVTATH